MLHYFLRSFARHAPTLSRSLLRIVTRTLKPFDITVSNPLGKHLLECWVFVICTWSPVSFLSMASKTVANKVGGRLALDWWGKPPPELVLAALERWGKPPPELTLAGSGAVGQADHHPDHHPLFPQPQVTSAGGCAGWRGPL